MRNIMAYQIGVLCILACIGCFVHFTREGCGWMDGHWASAQSRCYSRICYYLGDCGGPWVQAERDCANIKPGETVANLYFYFGNPHHKDEQHLSWQIGKPDAATVTATLVDGRLSQLNCGKP